MPCYEVRDQYHAFRCKMTYQCLALFVYHICRNGTIKYQRAVKKKTCKGYWRIQILMTGER
jgi:hypothetical protein